MPRASPPPNLTQCGEHIAKGVRFNAEKQATGAYYSTKIWSFAMRHHCGCRIVIRTDPQGCDYVVAEGARRKVESWDAGAVGSMVLDTEEAARRAADPLAKLEDAQASRARAAAATGSLADLAEEQELKHWDSYGTNKALRAALRAAKKEDAALEGERRQLGLPEGLRLLPASEEDGEAAAIALNVSHGDDRFRRNWQSSRKVIMQQSIFADGAAAASVPSTSGRAPAAAAAVAFAAPSGSTARRQSRQPMLPSRLAGPSLPGKSPASSLAKAPLTGPLPTSSSSSRGRSLESKAVMLAKRQRMS